MALNSQSSSKFIHSLSQTNRGSGDVASVVAVKNIRRIFHLRGDHRTAFVRMQPEASESSDELPSVMRKKCLRLQPKGEITACRWNY